MSKKQGFMLDVMSGIDEDIVDRNLKKRFELWFSRGKKPKRNRLIPILASAACLLLVATMVFLLWPKTPIDNGKQAPVYLGMSVSNDAPVVSAAAEVEDNVDYIATPLGSTALKATPILLNGNGNNENKGNKGNNGKGNDKNNSSYDPEINGGPYYAMPSEDIYIHIHFSNPDEFEILSFTLNGTKYSSYMFEAGSDLETLILKCNVGELTGVMQYTIDAIKYVDGEEIKDVKMEGDRTIEVIVGQAESYLGFEILLDGFDVNITPVWSDGFTGEKKILTLAVYDGETLIKECSPEDRTISGLPNNSRFVLVATYKNGDETETSRYIFDTRKTSDGLRISAGKITGIGTCTDTVLYLDTPIAEDAFLGNKFITAVYFGAGVTSIGNNAFDGCIGLTEIIIPQTVEEIGESAFYGCVNIKTAKLPADKISLIPNDNLEIVLITGGESIAENAFRDYPLLRKVNIAEGIESIGKGAFYGCEKLDSITIPASVTSIGEMAFGKNVAISVADGNTAYRFENDCLIETESKTLIWGTAKSVIPTDVVAIADAAFYNCEDLTEITIPDSVTTVGARAFEGCANIKSATLPANAISFLPKDKLEKVCITSGAIEKDAYKGYTLLSEVSISEEVISIGDNSFDGCSGITKIDISNGVTTIGNSAFCGCIKLESISIPESVTTLGESAFSGCVELASADISNGVTTIGSSAFYGCIKLESISIPESVTTLGESAFSGCVELASANIPSAVTKIEKDLFRGCNKLSSVTIPDGVTAIGENAFNGCSGFESINVPNAVTTIGTDAFKDCSGVKTVVASGFALPYIPMDSVEALTIISDIEENFYGLKNLKSVSFSKDVTSLKKIACSLSSVEQKFTISVDSENTAYRVEDNCLIDNAANILLVGRNDGVIPNGVVSIGEYAFGNYNELTSITLPDTVTSVDDSAFDGCVNIKTAKLPAAAITATPKNALETLTVTSGEGIAEGAFKDCKTLASVTLPEGVTSIGESAFDGCLNLTSVSIPNSVTALNGLMFVDCAKLNITLSAEHPVYRIENNCLIEKATNELVLFLKDATIASSVVGIRDYAFSARPDLESITIPQTVTDIESEAFYNCNNIKEATLTSAHLLGIPKEALEAVVITSGESIAEGAFKDCKTLASVTLSEGVTSIGESAFDGCLNLTSVSIPNSVTALNGLIFVDCAMLNITLSAEHPVYRIENNCLIEKTTNKLILFLKDATIASSVVGIRDYAFSARPDLESITIPKTVTSISSEAFYNCNNIKEATLTSAHLSVIPKNSIQKLTVTSGNIPEQAFSSCASLKSLIIQDGITSIGKKAFFECTNLSEVTIPDSVTSIGEKAFKDCSITKATVPAFAIEHIRNYKDFDDIDIGHCPMLRELVVTSGVIEQTHCIALQKVTICDGVTSIGRYAFSYCSKLTDVSIADGVKIIDDYAFSECYSLKTITIPDSVTKIGEGAFNWCTSLQSITIPDSVTRIEQTTFWNCTSLKTITISNNIKYISNDAFSIVGDYEEIPYVLETIVFKGTKNKWSALGVSFSAELPQIKVECTDGTITI